ncbi:DENN domain-containing protein [Nymphaea thermarum]|nr:DENN domain-containing protein [Nymphaea thermarum]
MEGLDIDNHRSSMCTTAHRMADTTALGNDNNDATTSSSSNIEEVAVNDRAPACSTLNRALGSTSTASVEDTWSPRWMPSFMSSPKRETSGGGGNSGLVRWKRQLQRAWKWGASARDQGSRSSFNPEVLANQKRQWYQLHSQSPNHNHYKEPSSLFEHFVIVGLHSNANFEATEDAFAKRKIWESEVAKSEILDIRKLPHRGPPVPILEPQILFKYPPGKKLTMRVKDLPAFCFPAGVKARLMERTPSMSDLNEVLYGQVAGNATLYGVCLHVQEIVQRPPGILGALSPLAPSPARGRFLVSAPRCYCLLTRVPFFELHYEMLNSIIAQERLERISQFVSEMTLTDSVPPMIKTREQMNASSDILTDESESDWMAYAIPVDSVLGLAAAAAGLISNNEVHSFSCRMSEPQTPESLSASEVSDLSQSREWDKDTRKNLSCNDDDVSEVSESFSESFDRLNGTYENGQVSPEIGASQFSTSRPIERIGSCESLISSVRSVGSEEDEVDEVTSKLETNVLGEELMEWAKVNKNELLQIVCAYHALPLPLRGSEMVFQPLEHLQPIKYCRPDVSALDLDARYTEFGLCSSSLEVAEFNAKLAAAEEALSLSVWTTATVCRALSLESVLALLTGALLEKQVVVICPNLGVLSAAVLSIIPMIRPFEWQSLLLPVLPRKMVDFLDAPVPFIMGSLPTLPRQRELIAELTPIHAKLACENNIAKRHPVCKCNEVQAEAAVQFLNVMRRYMESLCSNLRFYTITSVQSNSDRVSLLLKESFIDSFPMKDRPFVKHFVDTQLFSVLSDSRLSGYENEQP